MNHNKGNPHVLLTDIDISRKVQLSKEYNKLYEFISCSIVNHYYLYFLHLHFCCFLLKLLICYLIAINKQCNSSMKAAIT